MAMITDAVICRCSLASRTTDGDVAVESSAVLALDGVKVAIATEPITGTSAG